MKPGAKVVEVLLDAALDWREARGLWRPRAVGGYQTLCGLWRPGEAQSSGLCFTGLCKDAGRFCRRTVAARAGEFTDFVWEATENVQTSSNRGRLLALSNHNDLGIYELCVQDGICDVTNTHGCSEEALKKLVVNKNLSLPSSFTLKILSFKSSTSFILLDNCTLLHLSWLEGATEANIVDAFKLCLPPEASEKITDSQICQGMLFLLDSAGWIYICDPVDGKQLGYVNLSLCQVGVFEDASDTCDLTCLSKLGLSPDLDVAVAVNSFNCAIYVSLNDFFREHPDHLQHTSKGSDDDSLRAPPGIDEDDLASSVYSNKVLNLPFQIDRSWTARLRAFYNKTKVPLAEDFLTSSSTPWHRYVSIRNSKVPHCQISSRKSGTYGRTEDISSLESKWHRTLQLQGLKESMYVETVSVSGFSVVFTLVAPDSGALTIIFWDLETQEVTYHHVDGHSLPVDGGGNDDLCLFLTDAGLFMAVFGYSQEDLLNRLMIYGKAGIVDSLCHLNNWNRCSIPIHALEAGIENRQLDTVDFFLKSKENLFSAPAVFLKQENPGAVLTSWAQFKNVEEMKPALDLLCSAIKEHHSESQSRQFSEQLLNLTLTFLNKQIQELLLQPGELDEHKQKCVDNLTGYIIKLRTFMNKYPHSAAKESVTDGCEDEENILPDVHQVYGKWKSLNTNELIRDAILNNQIPRAQGYFRAQDKPLQNLNKLVQAGLTLTYDCLLKKDLQEAKKLLKNMGFDVKKDLHRICCYTADGDLRDFLVESLQDYVSDEEKEMVKFVHFVENQCSSSAHAVKSPLSHSLLQVEDIDSRYSVILEQVMSCEVGITGHPSQGNPNSCTVVLDWAKWWDNVAKERIRLSGESGLAIQSCNPEVLWTSLTSRHSWAKISDWIEVFQAGEGSTSWPALTAEIVDQNTCCSSYMRNEILNNLARQRLFIPSELADFGHLLARLGCTGGVMQDPHIIPVYQSSEGLDFHSCFILYCLKHDLRYLLYAYLDHYGLRPSNCPLLDKGALHVAHPWFEFLMRIREVADNPGDTSVVFQASLANAQMLIPSNQASVSSMLLEGHTLMALATIMFAPGGIDRVMQKKEDVGDSLWKVDPQLLKMALAPYPKLRAALFPQLTPHGIPPPDISLYHLLQVQSLHPFDPSQLFGWQSANLLSTCDFSNDLPHFSCPDLVNKYGVTERLDFSYYLFHGRPSYAFATFLVQQLVKSSSAKQLIQRVSVDAYSLALAHFTVPAVTAASIAFLELLGVSSFKLRIDLKVANVILKQWCTKTEESQHSSLQHSLADKLQNLVEGYRSSAEDLLTHLENATWENIERKNIKRASFEAGQEWSLMAQFCRLHGLTLSVAYLQACAQEDEWLQFVVFSQLHNYQPEEVKALLKDFSPIFRDHLTLAFENLQFVSQQQPTGCTVMKKESSKESKSPKDLFQVLYRCQENPNPWRYLLTEAMQQNAPVLAVLAACFQETDILQCLYVWVVMSSDDVTISEVTKHIDDSVEYHEWNLHDLSLMWKVLLGRRKSKQLVRGFQLFQKDCPWVCMLEMYELCTEHKNYKEAKLKIQEFQKCLQSAADSADATIPVEWMESQASLLLKLMMQQCPTQYELGKLLQLLADVDYAFVPSGPDFQKLSRLAQLLQETSISIDRSLFADYSVETLQCVCGKILNQLQKKGLFVLARQVAELAELPADSLLVDEVSQELQNLKQCGQWQRKETRINFWKKCHNCFKSNLISNIISSEFFLSQANDKPSTNSGPPSPFKEQLLESQESCMLLTLAGHWLSSSTPPLLEQLEEVEKRIWLCHIRQQTLLMSTATRFAWQVSVCGELTFEDATKEFLFSNLPALNSPKYLKLEGFPTKDVASNCRLGTAEKEALHILIGNLLDEGCIHEASRVSRYFEFYNQDLSLVLHCRALASGEVQSNDFHPSIKVILAAGTALNGEMRPHRKRLPSMSNIASSFVQSPEDNVVKDQNVQDLHILIKECLHGKSYCHQVLSLYELSKELGFSFNDISAQDSYTVLREVLSSQQPDRYSKAQAFIPTQGLTAEAVATLVADEVVQALLSSTQSRGQGVTRIYNLLDGKEAFLQLAKLCQDPILVGTKLLDKISSISTAELECTVELLILAHDCFSLTCHMEGISRVLQAARHLSHKHLAPNEEYSLMVRLITGIGRYNDMTYIFDLLHENHRFEMLLRKSMVSNGNLKMALLDYIKRCLPGDSEKHNMVAFCFSMCREIGENHEGAARIQLKIIESQPWEVTPELKKSLVKTLSFLKDAAESYSKDSCIRRASQCVKLAKLVTLQLHFLNNNQDVQLINLQRNDLMTCILSLPRFYQASIVAEAYDFVPDWAEVLYQHVIVSGDFAYLEEFKQQHLLQHTLFEEISAKFKQHKGDAGASQNLKRLLQYCEDVYLFYKMAYEHNFTDIANKLLKEPQTRCYLKDRIAS